MKARALMAFALVLLFSFAGRAMAAESWMDSGVKECKEEAPAAGAQAVGTTDPLASAVFMVTYCTTVAQCPCQAPACACTATHRCICNFNLCCPGGECP